jgi:RNA polymerase sigma factor (sigma-70 family)
MQNNSKKYDSLFSLIDESSKLIERFIWNHFPHLDHPDKEDITQEVKIKILKLLKSGRKIGNLKSYIQRVVYTTALDAISKNTAENLRDKKVELNLANHLSEFNIIKPEQMIEEKRINQILYEAINSLSQNRRIVVKMHLKGLNVREIAEHLGWSISRVNHLFYRGIEDLRKKIDKNFL